MLTRLSVEGIELPRLYIAENKADALLAMQKGVPFIRWTLGKEELIRRLLRPTLEKLFPDIRWNKILGRKKPFRTVVYEYHTDIVADEESVTLEHVDPASKDIHVNDEHYASEPFSMTEPDEEEEIVEVADVTDNSRYFSNEGGGGFHTTESIETYIGDLSSQVNLDVLQALNLLPSFIGDICDCIRRNLVSGVKWSEGYNKKHMTTTGNYDRAGELRNLIILDVSGSIPRGISATMISLIDTLRTQVQADLIITAASSRFYPMDAELPDPDTIRNTFSLGNESYEFFDILTKHIQGKHYGHVISFGDNDTPAYTMIKSHEEWSLSGTVVEHVHHYHTRQKDTQTGYAKWCHMLGGRPPIVSFNTEWCKVIDDRR